MVNVKHSMHQFSNFIADGSLPKDLEPLRPTTETEQSTKVSAFSQRAIEFLEKFDKRKLNQLIELSNMKI